MYMKNEVYCTCVDTVLYSVKRLIYWAFSIASIPVFQKTTQRFSR